MNINNGGARPPSAPKTRDKMDGSAIRCHVLLLALLLASCAAPDTQHQIVVSTREQKLALIDRGNVLAIYPVSTSKFGLGDWRGSRFTPLGKLQVAQKIGDSAPPGTVFKDRLRTGEIVAPTRLSRAFSGCADWRRKTPTRFLEIFTSTVRPRNSASERLRAMDASGCVRATSYNYTTS